MIRLYGTTLGQGSFSRVTYGMRQALKELGVLAGVVPLDAYDGEESYPGWDAPVAVYVGDPRGVDIMTTVGDHKKRYVLLPPNSDWMPRELLAHVAKSATHLLAPSEWALDVQSKYVLAHGMGAALWRHGVDDRFTPSGADAYLAKQAYFDDIRPVFRVLHMTSTVSDRKGTRELVRAWTDVHARLGMNAQLAIVANPGLVERALRDPAWRDAGSGTPSITWVARGEGFSVDAAVKLYRNVHVVCQPSRGEGFGLVPLEARACGVPIVATACTGHADHVHAGDPGVVIVSHGEEASTDDGPGALSPQVEPSAIGDALVRAYKRWPELALEALGAADPCRQAWSWKCVTEAFLKQFAGSMY